MRLSDHCQRCGGPKLNLTATHCEDCFAAKAGAEAAAAAEGQDADGVRLAGLRALEARSHKAHRNFPDPRAMDRKTIWMTGNIPQAERPRP